MSPPCNAERPGCFGGRAFGLVWIGVAYIFWGLLFVAFCGPGGDLLSQVLRHSTIGARTFDGRVRDGIGSDRSAKVTRPAKVEKEANFFGACTHPNDADDTGLAKVLYDFAQALSRRHRTHGHRVMRAFKPIELLVPVSCTHCCASTPG